MIDSPPPAPYFTMEDDDASGNEIRGRSQNESSGSELSEEDRELLAENIRIGAKRTHSVERDSDEELEHMFDEEEALAPPKQEPIAEAVKHETYDEEEDDMRDFIEEDDESGGEGHVGETGTDSQVKSIHKPLWFDRGLSRETLHDLMDIFGDGSDYVELVLAGMRQLSLKKTSDVVEDKAETEDTTLDQEVQLEELAFPWLTSRLCSLSPDRFEESEALRATVKTVAVMLNSGLAVPFIAFHRKEHISNLNINDIWTISDEMRRWNQISRKRKVVLHTHHGLVDQLQSLNLDPLDRLIGTCEDEDVLDACNEFLSELKRSSRGKGKFAKALGAHHLDTAFCPSPSQFANCLNRNASPDSLQLPKRTHRN